MESKFAIFLPSLFLLFGCFQADIPAEFVVPQPKEIIDLGALVTEDLTIRVWGERYPREGGYDRPNVFDVIHWQRGPINGSNAYYTLFNHGGPHVDAPVHMGFTGGLNSYSVESFAGPLKVFDVSHSPFGRTVGKDVFDDQGIRPGDIVLIHTNYQPPKADDEYPSVISLTPEAAEFLARIPVRAFATDAWSVDVGPGSRASGSPTEKSELIPIHSAFLSRGIPAYEQLFNVDMLLNKKNMYFVGQPLNIRDGDGMIVRPFVLVY